MLDFSNATVLSYSHTPQFLGDNLRYKITKNITVEGWLLTLMNSSGVSGIYDDINALVLNSNDYDSIILNGYNLGQGRIDSFDFDKDDNSKDVQYKKYRVNLEVYDNGNLFNVLSGYYSGISWNNAEILANFDESFSFERRNDDSSEYSHEISLRFNSGISLPDSPLGMAKTFASGFFNALNLTGFLGLSYNKLYKRFYTETYNLIDNSASYKQNVEFPKESGVYAVTYNHSLQLGTDGITTITENSSIKGLYDPIYDSLKVGLEAEISQSLQRCSGIFNHYVPSGAYPLNINPINKNISINKFEGTATFDIEYNNNPKYINLYSWEYTTTIDVSEDRTFIVNENGKIEGFGRPFIDKFSNTQLGYSSVKTGIAARVSGIYLLANPYPLNLNLISTTEGFSLHEGSISYTQSYTDNITLFPSSGIRMFEITISDKMPTQLVNKFNILGVKEIVQPSNQGTLGQRDIEINIVGNRNTPVSNYLSFASGQLSGYKTLGLDIWTNTATYKFDPINNKFDLNVGYNYDGAYKNFTDIIYSGISS